MPTCMCRYFVFKGRDWISEILICMDKKFQIIDCPTEDGDLAAMLSKVIPPEYLCPMTAFFPETLEKERKYVL